MQSKRLKALQVANWHRDVSKLTADDFSKFKPKSLYDGAGLMILASSPKSASWLLRYQFGRNAQGRPVRRDHGLGGYPDVTLEKAREKASAARALLRGDGKDPIDTARLEAAARMTFKEAAEAFLENKKHGWRNAKHRAQWSSTLETYAYPVIGNLPVGSVDTSMVTRILEPIWATKTETASRLRQRIERVLAYAQTRGYRSGENPARWKGHLENILPARGAVQAVRHHSALPYSEMPRFMAALTREEGTAAVALQFLILTATRTGEVLNATWPEIDLDAALWVIPAARMKAKRDHRVLLSAPALAILEKQKKSTGGKGFVFPGMEAEKPLSNMALLMLLRRMKRDDLTAHGFRATFKTWATESTNFPREAIEISLAHAVGDSVEQAYLRGDLLKKRAGLMSAWGSFATAAPDERKVVQMRKARG